MEDYSPKELVRHGEDFYSNIDELFFMNKNRENLKIFVNIGNAVVDPLTMELIDGSLLYETLDRTQTLTGSAVLYGSFMKPSMSLGEIQEKQELVGELRRDPSLRKNLLEYFKNLSRFESQFYAHVLRQTKGGFRIYRTFNDSKRFLGELSKIESRIGHYSSKYLENLTQDIEMIDSSRVLKLIRGPLYRTRHGLRHSSEISTPFRVKFSNRLIKPEIVVPIGVVPILAYAFGGNLFAWGVSASTLVFQLPMFYYWTVPPLDKRFFINPLGELLRNSEEVKVALHAVGKIDEALTFSLYGERLGSHAVVPELQESKSYFMSAKGLVNSALFSKIPDFVPNDVELGDERLTIITGPNSGGKTTYCKTIAQTQLLAQMGCVVPAESAKMSIADKIFYQAPTFDSLKDTEGRFGTELARTKEIFYQTTPKSLVLIDELAEGTTIEEKTKISEKILKAFYQIGNSTVLVTHNHDLAKSLQEQQIGKFLQVEFAGNQPTHKVTPGISEVSHAEIVMKKMNFSDEDIKKYLESIK